MRCLTAILTVLLFWPLIIVDKMFADRDWAMIARAVMLLVSIFVGEIAGLSIYGAWPGMLGIVIGPAICFAWMTAAYAVGIDGS